MPTVSVITPAHDVEPFLRDTIESVLAQTFGDWELVIVNDGSRDGTAAIADEYAARDSRVRVIHQENRGLAAARNAALLAGRGQFFALLDGDDTWDPGFLAAQMMVFERHPETALVTGSARLLGGPSHGCLACPEIPGTPVLALDEMIADETAVFIMTVFRRAVVDAIGPFDAAKRRSEDWDFWLRAVAAGFVLRRHWTPLGWYRVRGGSLSQNTAAMLEEMLHTLGKVRRATADTRAQAIADRQIARFERQLLLERAKGALDRGDASQARIQLEALEAQGAGPLIVLTAWLARHAPSAACAAYRLRHLRPRWMRAREPHRVRAGLTT